MAVCTHSLLTSSRFTVGTGVIGDHTGPMPSQNVYSAQSVLIIVHEAPSLIVSLDALLEHGVAYTHINRHLTDYHRDCRAVQNVTPNVKVNFWHKDK